MNKHKSELQKLCEELDAAKANEAQFNKAVEDIERAQSRALAGLGYWLLFVLSIITLAVVV